jgi:hypothetical protein
MEVREGEGWRLVCDAARAPFPLLIGGGDPEAAGWAAEFSAPEASALALAVQRLVEQHRLLVDSLLAEEAIELELETACEGGSLWLGLAGDRLRWQLRFVLTPLAGRRAIEGGWGEGASQAMAAALANLQLPQPPAPDTGLPQAS